MHEARDESKKAASLAPVQRSKQEMTVAPAPDMSTARDARNASVNVATDSSPSIVTDAAEAAPASGRPDTVEQWIKDTQDSDPKIRAAAIARLANAPKSQALPALKDVLEMGEPEVDRHIALNSLHTLALRDGDSNGQVRDVMRRAIYHSDNDGVTQTAQSLLDDVEAALAEQ